MSQLCHATCSRHATKVLRDISGKTHCRLPCIYWIPHESKVNRGSIRLVYMDGWNESVGMGVEHHRRMGSVARRDSTTSAHFKLKTLHIVHSHIPSDSSRRTCLDRAKLWAYLERSWSQQSSRSSLRQRIPSLIYQTPGSTALSILPVKRNLKSWNSSTQWNCELLVIMGLGHKWYLVGASLYTCETQGTRLPC